MSPEATSRIHIQTVYEAPCLEQDPEILPIPITNIARSPFTFRIKQSTTSKRDHTGTNFRSLDVPADK
jgi:hypothetical protein